MSNLDSLAVLTAQPKPLKIGDRTYQVHPLAIADFGALQAWVDSRQPDPFAKVAEQIGIGRFTPAQERHLLNAAVEVATKPKPKIGEPEADAILKSLDGITQMLYLSIRKGDPAFTEANANALASKLGPEGIVQALSFTNVDMIVGDSPDPKAPATTGTGEGTP